MRFNQPVILALATLVSMPAWAAELVDGRRSELLYQRCLTDVAERVTLMFPKMAMAAQHELILTSCELAEDAYVVDSILMTAQLLKDDSMTHEKAQIILQQAYVRDGGRAVANKDLRAAAIKWLTSSARYR